MQHFCLPAIIYIAFGYWNYGRRRNRAAGENFRTQCSSIGKQIGLFVVHVASLLHCHRLASGKTEHCYHKQCWSLTRDFYYMTSATLTAISFFDRFCYRRVVITTIKLFDTHFYSIIVKACSTTWYIYHLKRILNFLQVSFCLWKFKKKSCLTSRGSNSRKPLSLIWRYNLLIPKIYSLLV